MSRISAGCPSALSILHARFCPALKRAAREILGDHHEAEDVVQESLLTLWQKVDRFDAQRCTPFGWAITITRRRAIDRLRWRARQKDLFEAFAASGSLTDEDAPSASSGRSALDSSDRQVIRCAIEALPPPLKQVLELFHFQGLTHNQIAVRSGTPLGTVKGRIRQAHRRLRSLLCHTGFLESHRRGRLGGNRIPAQDSAGKDFNPLAS